MSKVGFWLKGSTGKLAGTTLYKGANGETIQREIVSRKEGDTWKRSTTYIAYPGETTNAYSMQQCLDLIANGAQHNIYSGSDQYLNNAGTGGGAAVESEQSGGGSQGGDTPAAQAFTISTATVNNQAMTVGSTKTVYIDEGESTIDLDIRVTFANVGNATAVGLFKGSQQVGTDHAISRTACSFTFAAVASGLRYWYEDLYTTEEDTVAAFCIVSRKEGDTWKRSTTYIVYPGETVNAYSMQECLDLISNGAQHAIYSGSDQYLNNAGTGGGAAVESEQGGESGGGSQGGGSTAQAFTISTATVNNQAMTVGSTKTVYIDEGESSIDLDIRVTFANVGNATAVGLFKGSQQVGTDHAIDGTGVNFTAAAQTSGTYSLKVKKSDNSWESVSYTISVQTNGGMGQD